jgi:DNA replication and repair protein RecF
VELNWIEVTGYRCYRSLRLEPHSGVNLLVGENGSGKTSLLEAIGYLASLASFRRSPDSSLIGVGFDEAVLRGEFLTGGRTLKVEVELRAGGRRRVLVNGKRPSSRSEVVAAVPLVAFLPDDLDLVKRGPAYRREYLDDFTARLWPGAAGQQGEYERALRQRNVLLRTEGRRTDRRTLEVWNDRLAHLGAAVIRRRLDLMERLGPVLTGLYGELAERKEDLRLGYQSPALGNLAGDVEIDEISNRLASALDEAVALDTERRVTTVGPHRDEMVVDLGGRDVRTRASQGEQRTVALGLRVASYQMLRDMTGDPPVLVLDDVFSELDPQRSRRLVERLPEGQVFISTARVEEVPWRGARWQVADGMVEPAGAAL